MTRAWLCLLLLACGGRASEPPAAPAVVAPPDAPPLDQDLPALAREAIAMYRDAAAAFARVGPDCAAGVVALDQLRARYADALAANRAVVAAGRDRELRAALAPYDAELDAAAASLMHAETLRRCVEDAAFARAFDAVFGR